MLRKECGGRRQGRRVGGEGRDGGWGCGRGCREAWIMNAMNVAENGGPTWGSTRAWAWVADAGSGPAGGMSLFA